MRKVLIVANVRKTQGGITTQINELTESLISEGIDTEVVSTHGSFYERILGIKDAYVKSKQFDVVLGVGCAYYGFVPIVIAFIISVLNNVKVVYNFHDGQVTEFIRKYLGLVKFVMNNEKVIVASEFLDSEFKKYGFNSEIINNHFNDLGNLKYKNCNTSKIGIMWARSFEKLYRVDLALEAAKNVTQSKNVDFHFYGGGSNYEYFKNKFCCDKIHFHGFKKRHDLISEYCKYQVFLNTSEYDNFPMSIVEAGLNKMVVVSSKVGGIYSIYKENEIVFFESGNLVSLMTTLNDVIENISNYESYSQNLYNKVNSFNWMSVREKWLNALNIINV